MYDKQKKLLLLILFLPLFFIIVAVRYSFADDTPTPTPSQIITPSPTPDNSGQVSALQQQISDYEAKISDLQNQENTLSSQIAVMDSQMAITKLRLNSVKEQILGLTSDIQIAKQKVSVLESSLNDLVKVLLNRVVATYESGSAPPLEVLFSSTSMSDFVSRANYLRIAQDHDKSLIYNTQQAKSDYANQKAIFEDKKKKVEALQVQLASYTTQLQQEKVSEQALLDETNSSEENYQKMLTDAQAQLSQLSSFALSRGGAEIISHQDISDSWGHYYNQRDANWGNNFIGLSTYQVWQVGCLMTSYAMVSSHFGNNITPADVASNTGNFFSNTAEFNIPGPAAGGHGAQWQSNPSLDSLRNSLNSGAVVIAGLSSNGGPYPTHYSDHWVVLRSVDGDSFKINDPWYEGAMNVSLNDHYAGWAIIEARVYN